MHATIDSIYGGWHTGGYMARSRKRTGRQFTAVKNSLRGAISNERNFSKALAENLNLLNADEFPPIIDWLSRYPSRSAELFPRSRLPQEDELVPRIIAAPSNDLSALLWLSAVAARSAEELTEFHSLSKEFERCLLAENSSQAGAALDAIEQRYGPSLWLLEARISHLHYTQGADAHKAFAREVHEKKPNSFAGFVAYYVSQRIEENVSFSRYAVRMERIIARQKVPEPLRHFARYLLLGRYSVDKGEVSKLCAVAASLNPIDTRQVLICLLEAIIRTSRLKPAWKELANHIGKFSSHDHTLENIRHYLCGVVDPRPAIDLPVSEKLVTGKFDEAIELGVQRLLQAPEDAETANSIAMAMAFLGREEAPPALPAIHRSVVTRLSLVYARQPGLTSAADELGKILLNLRIIPFGQILSGYLLQEWRNEAETSSLPAVGSYLFGDTLHAISIRNIEAPLGALTLKAKAANISPSMHQFLSAHFDSGSPAQQVHKPILLEALATGSSRRGMHDDAVRFSSDLLALETAVWKRRAAGLLVFSLSESGNVASALRQLAAFCCNNDDLRFVMPLQAVLGGLRWVDLAPYKNDISLVIALDLYVRTVSGDEHIKNRRHAFEEFRVSTNNGFPSDLDISRFPLDQIVYFLWRVCIPSIMDVSYKLFPSSSRALDEERVKICALLSRIDPENTTRYNEEIKDITTRKKIQDGLRDVDRSRIYVNADAIKRWAEKELRETFEKCKSQLVANYNPDAAREFNTALISLLEGKDVAVDNYLSYPNDEGAELLVDIVQTIENEYLSNADNGLIAYLSMRVRHGSFEGHLRRPVEDAMLVTLRNKDTRSYDENSHWSSIFKHLDNSKQSALQKALKVFATSYDKVLDEAVDEKLHIRSEKKPNGLFFFTRLPLWYHLVKNRIEPNTTFEQFLDYVFQILPGMLLDPLSEVQEYVAHDVKSRIAAAFDQLRSDMAAILPNQCFLQINEEIAKASQEVQGAITRVANWFKTEREETESVLRPIGEIIDIAIEATKSAHHGFNPVISKVIKSQSFLTSSALGILTDILFIILGNVAKHSNMPTPQTDILIETMDMPAGHRPLMRIRVESEIAPSDVDPRLQKLEKIRTLIASGEYRQHTNREGGSGLLKLNRYVAADNNQALDFGHLSETRFFVELMLSILPLQTEPVAP